MNGVGDQIIFSQLLERHRRIRIPMIQRDYAQGRSTEEQVREDFLSALHDALLLPPEDESLPLNLDFVYGSVEGVDEETRFLPLDGQQRLTTLFLLHWYLAWKDGRHDEFGVMFGPQGFSQFSYSVRPSSTEFFDALVRFRPDSSPNSVPSLTAMITNQPWYFRSWRLDPTIQSSLTMLDAIHQHFRASEACFSRLIDTEQPAITFQLLDLENFGLSDDLYIKMNGRGIPLTFFETFKARYEQLLEEQFSGETRIIGDQSLPVAKFFARRMDTAWADFFWSHRDEETNLYDEAVMNLFRAVALVTRDPESDSYLDDMSSLRNRQLKSTYSIFDSRHWLDRTLSGTLFLLLETWSKDGADFKTQLPNTRFFDEVTLFTSVVGDPMGLSYVDIVQFAAYVVFIREHADDIDSNAFQEWMRIVFNLSVNTSYDRLADLQRSIAGIFELAPNSDCILQYFSTMDRPATGFDAQQVQEEALKAHLIQIDQGWRPLIDKAEHHGYFRGQIGFLLEFCGAEEKWRDTGCVDWGSGAHCALQERFQYYLSKAESMFVARGLTEVGEHRWERALLSIGNYLLPSGRHNQSFLINSQTDQASWKRLLRGRGAKVPEARNFLQQLWNRLPTSGDISDQLDAIIHEATNLEPWRLAFVYTPKSIEYCERRAIRWIAEDVVYLLKRSQMNGAHAELFTFCLYHNQLLSMEAGGGLEPLKLQQYKPEIGTDMEPGIEFIWSHDGYSVKFGLERSGGGYIIFVNHDYLAQLSGVNCILRDVAGFHEGQNQLERVVSPSDIETRFRELTEALAKVSNQDAARG